VAKNIRYSVGKGGQNALPHDVMTVQYLLNCVPAGFGGPHVELAVDGMCGPKTIAAIEAFQRKVNGWSDGRVDANGGTLKRLQSFDPAPFQPLPAGGDAKGPWESAGFGPGGKSGGMPAGKEGFPAEGGKDAMPASGSKAAGGSPGGSKEGSIFGGGKAGDGKAGGSKFF
jgi:peptidoglycan hydrolase-like protein with peptidoglycan-binding domain